ncbi:MAG: 16S rRNA (guanine(527)-N(7))-methyltransferase RsmG [Oscillospiraceae bacterium]|jgi:16S rRNA (guanine527-N7)-methyltransferase|nr:16S rRNA (guanine(527)-N(7))-methyltransferase RsmG [Oscillospiraceae bacterium]
MNNLNENLERFGIFISKDKISKFKNYSSFLKEYNKKVNLTSIIDPEEIAEKHFIDSLLIIKTIKIKGSVIDVGSGAGFPGVPLKIFDPQLELTLLESCNKKICFLTELSKKIDVKFTTIKTRAEVAAHQDNLREKFENCTARALAPLNILCELCLPFVKKEGFLISMKGPNYVNEITAAEKSLQTMGGEIQTVKNFTLSNSQSERNIIIIKKIKSTPSAFPRSYSKIKNKPLI